MLTSIGVAEMARDMATHAVARQRLTAENVANADTPGFVARDLPDFAATLADGGSGMRATRPNHISTGLGPRGAEPFAAPTEPSPDGNSVSIEKELLRAARIRNDHDTALGIQSGLRDILRYAMGRIR